MIKELATMAMNPGKTLKAISSIAFPMHGAGMNFFTNWGTNSGEFEGTNADRIYSREVGQGLSHNVLMTPVNWVADHFPEAPIALQRKDADGNVEVDFDNALTDLIAKPNPAYNGDALVWATIFSYLIDGNAYWVKVCDGAGIVRELWYIPHNLIKAMGTADKFISHYEYRPGGTVIRLEVEDVVHFRYGLDPRDIRRGFSRLAAIIREVFSDGEASSLVSALLKNRGVPGILITPDKDVTIAKEDEGDLKRRVEQLSSGGNRGRSLFLSAMVKIQQFAFSPKDMDLSMLRNVSEERTCAAVGVPAVVVGFGTGINSTSVGATMRENVKLGWANGIQPVQRVFGNTINQQLLPFLGIDKGWTTKYDTSGIEALQEDRLKLSQALAAEVAGGITEVGEARRQLDYEVRPEHAVRLVPFNLIEVPAGSTAAEAEAEGGGSDDPAGGKPPTEDPENEPDDNEDKGVRATWIKANLTVLQRSILRIMDRSRKRLERGYRAAMTVFLAQYGREVEAAYLRAAEEPKGWHYAATKHTAEVGAEQVKIWLKDPSDDILLDAFIQNLDMVEQEGLLRSVFGVQYSRIFQVTAGSIEQAIGAEILDIPDTLELDIVERGSVRSELVDLTKHTRSKAFEVIRDGRAAGSGPLAIARKLRDVIPPGIFRNSTTRAALIARTETRFAQNISAFSTYQNMEGATGVQIVDARLGSTDADCEAINGDVLTFEQGEAALVEEHPNGTRDLLPFFGEFPEGSLARRA